MGISAYPLNSNEPVSLKLIAAARLPENISATNKTDTAHSAKKSSHGNPVEHSDEALVEIGRLKARDTQVRQHEQAHISASGGLNVSGASFTYQRGPNGISYAVGGDVKIDTSPGHTPEETLARAEKIIDAALAPADPSPADRSIAAKAQNMALQARLEIQQQESNLITRSPDPQALVNLAYDSKYTVKAKIDTFV